MKAKLDFTLHAKLERQKIDATHYTTRYWQIYLGDIRPGSDLFWAEDYWEIASVASGFGEHIMSSMVRFRIRLAPL